MGFRIWNSFVSMCNLLRNYDRSQLVSRSRAGLLSVTMTTNSNSLSLSVSENEQSRTAQRGKVGQTFRRRGNDEGISLAWCAELTTSLAFFCSLCYREGSIQRSHLLGALVPPHDVGHGAQR